MKYLKPIFSLLYILSFTLSIHGQETVQDKYDELLESTATYEQYKMIPKTSLDAFWSEMTDSLNQNRRIIRDLRLKMDSQQALINSFEEDIAEVQSKLDESLALSDTIHFMGIPFSKLGYHVLVWLIIIALGVLAVMSYLVFLKGNKVTTRTMREFAALTTEFETHKDQARERQVKLKRELQTAVNKLNERR